MAVEKAVSELPSECQVIILLSMTLEMIAKFNWFGLSSDVEN